MKKLDRVGERYTTKEGYEVEIVEYLRDNNCSIKFENGTIKHNVNFCHIKSGKIRNPYHLSVYGMGYIGEGNYSPTVNRKTVKSYNVWNSMLQRCYDKNFQKRQPTYSGCYVVKEWRNYQNFAKWFEENYVEGFQLDKDIIFKGNKEYGPDTCFFLPQELNHAIIINNQRTSKYPIGVKKDKNVFSAQISINGKNTHLGSFKTVEAASASYISAKLNYIKDIAEKYKSQMPIKLYNILINKQ